MSAPDPVHEPDGVEPLFHTDGDLLVPSALTQGPWYEGTLHGGAMLAVMARAVEGHPSDVDRRVVRLTVDMMRAAPIAPLRLEATTARSGKAVEVVDASLFADDALCVRATALRMRTEAIAVDDVVASGPSPQPPGPGSGSVPTFDRTADDEPAFHHVFDVHVDSDASTVWFRLTAPVVAGEPNSEFVTVAMISDWTYAVPFLLGAAAGTAPPPDERTTFAINADTTINLHRPMVGAWLGLKTVSHAGPSGIGTSAAGLFDADGPVGFSTQSILIRGPGAAHLSVKEVSV